MTLPMMAAAILSDEQLALHRTPQLTDVSMMADLLRRLGIEVAEKGTGSFCRYQQEEPIPPEGKRCLSPFPSREEREEPGPCCAKYPSGCAGKSKAIKKGTGTFCTKRSQSPFLSLQTVDDRPVRADYDLLRKMRAGFCVLGPLLVRRGRAEVAMPGGCSIGDRPVDLHLKGLEKLGAKISIEHGYVVAEAKKLTGTTIDMAGKHGPTVTGTIHLLSTATLAEGTTTILGAAIEPEVTELGKMLVRMGAKISGLGTSTLLVKGVKRLGGVEHRVIFDRIEAATLLFAAAITAGSVTVCGVVPKMLAMPLALLEKSGCEILVEEESVSVSCKGPLQPIDMQAEPYPGMPTDLQAQWMTLMTQAAGVSTIADHVFPGRFMHIAELRRLGADIEHVDGPAIVRGPIQLKGADVTATDLRAGAALVLAGLIAEGETRVFGLEFLNRGYDRLNEKLSQLGAKIT